VPDFVKVVDFGLVKELAPNEDVSVAGTFAGTPAYLAPEALTQAESVGPASDLYAVGTVAYFLLTGKQVFEGRSMVEVCSHHLHTAPVPPSKRSDVAIPPELERLVLDCLAKAPADRPASARDLADALSSIPVNGWTKRDAEAWWQAFEKEAREPIGIEVADTVALLPRGSIL
jgi:serine/threonine-protein kinase